MALSTSEPFVPRRSCLAPGDLLTRPVTRRCATSGVVVPRTAPATRTPRRRARRGGDPSSTMPPHPRRSARALPPVCDPSQVTAASRRQRAPAGRPHRARHRCGGNARSSGKLRDARASGRQVQAPPPVARRRLRSRPSAPPASAVAPSAAAPHDERAPIHARCLASAFISFIATFRRRLPGTIAARAHFRSSGKKTVLWRNCFSFPCFQNVTSLLGQVKTRPQGKSVTYDPGKPRRAQGSSPA